MKGRRHRMIVAFVAAICLVAPSASAGSFAGPLTVDLKVGISESSDDAADTLLQTNDNMDYVVEPERRNGKEVLTFIARFEVGAFGSFRPELWARAEGTTGDFRPCNVVFSVYRWRQKRWVRFVTGPGTATSEPETKFTTTVDVESRLYVRNGKAKVRVSCNEDDFHGMAADQMRLLLNA